ncbi:MAG: hypothetical protein GF329_03010 [Candidatus Lokiarchaeota archaeon]|nr:hypothetical protein [Candidatus Lokiarchaeota archaeon]
MQDIRIFTAEDIYLVLTTVLGTLLFQMAVFFFIKWRRYDKKLRLQDQVINLSMSIFFLFWGLANFVALPFDLGEVEARLGALKMDLLFFVIGTFALIYTLMKILEIKHKKIYLGVLLSSILIVLLSQTADNYLWYYVILSSVLFVFIIYFIRKAHILTHGEILKNLIPIFIGLLIFSTSYIRKNLNLLAGSVIPALGEFDDLLLLNLDKMVDIFGMLLISLGFYLVEFAELKWKQAIKHLMVINKGGICLYYYPFVEIEEKEARVKGKKTGKGGVDSEDFDRQLAAGAIMGVQSILGEVIDKKSEEQLEVVDYKGKKLLFTSSPENYINVVLISEQDLLILHEKIEKLAKQIETYFKDYLEKNITKIDLYKPISYLIEEIFHVDNLKRDIILKP